MYDDDANWQSYFRLIENMYKEHPIRVDIAGTIESIAEITKEYLYLCYNTFYHPSNMMLVVVGNFDKENILKLVKENQDKKEFKPPFELKRNVIIENMVERKEDRHKCSNAPARTHAHLIPASLKFREESREERSIGEMGVSIP